MRLLHTSDWHLGASEGDRSLYDDQKHFIDEICDIVEREKIDTVIIAGDVYDKSVSSGEAIRLYDYAMRKLCLDMNCEVIVVAGNHDSADRLAGCKDLLKKSGLHVIGALERVPSVVSYKDVDIYLMPWFTEEKVKGLFPEKKNEIMCLTDAYRVVCDCARDTFDLAKKHIAVAHAFITNAAVSDSDKAAKIASVGTALQVDADVFDGFDYVALGHIHGPQNIRDTVRYCGTPMAYSFGREEKQEKSVTVIDTINMKKTFVPLHPFKKRTTIEGTFEDIMNANFDAQIKNGYVRIKVTDRYVGLEAASQLKDVYPYCLEIQGKVYESEDTGRTMTMQEFEKMKDDPVAIFESYCMDVRKEKPNEHILEIFRECMESENDE